MTGVWLAESVGNVGTRFSVHRQVGSAFVEMGNDGIHHLAMNGDAIYRPVTEQDGFLYLKAWHPASICYGLFRSLGDNHATPRAFI